MRAISASTLRRILLSVLVVPALSLGGAPAAFAAGGWWDAAWQFRVPVTIGAAGHERVEKPAEVAVNFTSVLTALGRSGVFDENSLRVVEVDAQGALLSASVPFQFDRDPDFAADTKASGTMVILLTGTTGAAQERYYHLYFGLTGGGFTPAVVAAQVTLTDNVTDAGQASFRIQASGSTYYYHKLGAGFSSWIDQSGNDWLSFDPTPGSGAAGEYRGIPNSVYPEGYFHPGKTSATSTIVRQGPVKVAFRSTTTDGLWECLWEVFPRYARMTMLKADHPFWLLYEGTPGGVIEPAKDFLTLSDGSQKLLSETWTADIAGEEWVYFSDPDVGASGRSLFFVQQEEDANTDSYFTLNDAMTVFGFGRDNVTPSITAIPSHLTIGLMEGTGFTASASTIRGAYKSLAVTLGGGEERSLGTPELVAPSANAVGQPTSVPFMWKSVAGATTYRLQAGSDSTFLSGVVFDDSTLADTSRTVAGLQPATAYFWRVQARTTGTAGPFSAYRRFSTGIGLATLRAPLNGALGQQASVTLRWSPIAGATGYRLQVGTDPTYGTGVLLDAAGLTDTSAQATGLPAGTVIHWRVSGESVQGSGGFTSSWQFTVLPAQPELVSPANGAAGTATSGLMLRWRSLRGATAYRVLLASDPSFATGIVVHDSTVTDTVKAVSGLAEGTSYYWRVAGRQGTADGTASVVFSFATTGQSPALLIPAAGSTGVISPVAFSWHAVQGTVHYHFQLATDSTFASGLVKNDSTLADTSRNVVGLAAGQWYFWRVRAKFSSGGTAFSAVRAFRTLGVFPSAPMLESPTGDQRLSDSTALCRWHPSTPGVTRYWFELSRDSLFALALMDTAVADTQKMVTGLTIGRYWWRVRAVNGEGYGPFASVARFEIIVDDVVGDEPLPRELALGQNYPNPFNPTTVIPFTLPAGVEVRLDVFTLLGEHVATLVDGYRTAGVHRAEFSSVGVSSGVYLYRLTAGSAVHVRTMLVLK